ncbi:hypothetical protein [Pelagibacterium sp.]|uniref:hypothetical protein n=1 Tax=Pelagibacterium sp. TaxID=1967288 RepID=UPI003A92A9E0
MKTTRSVFAGTVSTVTAIVFFAAFAIVYLLWLMPDVWRDIQIVRNPVVLTEFSIVGGECSPKRGSLKHCDLDLFYAYEGRAIKTHSSFAFVDPVTPDYSVRLVISADRPELVTIDLALDGLWKRIVVASVFITVFVGMAALCLILLRRIVRNNAAARRGGLVRPVPLEIRQTRTLFGGTFISYVPVLPDPKKRFTATARLRITSAPIQRYGNDGTCYALGAQMDGVDQPILLDADLTQLDFTAQERVGFVRALERADTGAR